MQASRITAAQYLRMSTDEQECSIPMQRETIARYARHNNLVVTNTYVDEGKSGLIGSKRPGLHELLSDVISGGTTFKVLLIYDVSRLGRFQDIDEAAHYEFLCREAGISVHCCAEEFGVECNVQNSLLKALKRTMAAQFSRELSDRVFEAKHRMAQRGLRMGSTPGYGLRRVLVSGNGKRKRTLAKGEYKNIQTDHIILEPGPKREVARVREIYSMALAGRSRISIIRNLNRRGITQRGGRRWTLPALTSLLTNRKYVGCNVWGQTSQKLRTPVTPTPQDHWAVRPAAFVPVVDQAVFDRVQEILASGTYYQTNEQLLPGVKRLLQHRGRLSRVIIERSGMTASTQALHRRFGGLKELYKLVGFKQSAEYYERYEKGQRSRKRRETLLHEILALFPENAGVVKNGNKQRHLLRFDNAVNVSVLLCRCKGKQDHKLQWSLNPVSAERGLPTLVCLLDEANSSIGALFLFPAMNNIGPVKFAVGGKLLGRAQQLASLSELYAAVMSLPHGKGGGREKQ